MSIGAEVLAYLGTSLTIAVVIVTARDWDISLHLTLNLRGVDQYHDQGVRDIVVPRPAQRRIRALRKGSKARRRPKRPQK